MTHTVRKLATLPFIVIALVAVALDMSACTTAPPEAAPTATDEAKPISWAEPTYDPLAIDLAKDTPLELVLPLADYKAGGYSPIILDPNKVQVEQDAQHYIVSKVAHDKANNIVISASRLTYEAANQLEDSTKNFESYKQPSETLGVVDKSGATVEPYALNMVVVSSGTEGSVMTFVVEPNREYVRAQS